IERLHFLEVPRREVRNCCGIHCLQTGGGGESHLEEGAIGVEGVVLGKDSGEARWEVGMETGGEQGGGWGEQVVKAHHWLRSEGMEGGDREAGVDEDRIGERPGVPAGVPEGVGPEEVIEIAQCIEV